MEDEKKRPRAPEPLLHSNPLLRSKLQFPLTPLEIRYTETQQ